MTYNTVRKHYSKYKHRILAGTKRSCRSHDLVFYYYNINTYNILQRFGFGGERVVRIVLFALSYRSELPAIVINICTYLLFRSGALGEGNKKKKTKNRLGAAAAAEFRAARTRPTFTAAVHARNAHVCVRVCNINVRTTVLGTRCPHRQAHHWPHRLPECVAA